MPVLGEGERYDGGVANGYLEHKVVVLTAIVLSCFLWWFSGGNQYH